MWKPLAEERAAKILQLERRLAEREESAPPPWPSERSITVILTVHGDKRLAMAREAYQSILNAGFGPDQIRICLTCPPSGYGKAYSEFSGHSYLDDLGPIDNNAAWLESCRRAQSSHIIILHDDDLMKPGLRAKLAERDGWEAAVWDAEFFGDASGGSDYFRCREGVYDGGLPADVAARLRLTPSTIQGCFPKWFLEDVFGEFQLHHNSLEARPGMKIGNDLLIWIRLARLGSVWVIREEYSRCRNHSDSTTVSGEEKLAELYLELRRRLSVGPKKILQICHLWGSGIHPKFMDSLRQNKASNPIRFLSSNKISGFDCGRIPNYETGSMADSKSRYGAANCAFVEAARIAVGESFDAMLYLETDCRFAGNGWDEVLRQEFIGCGNVVCAGSPVVWGAFAGRHKRALKILDYSRRYTEATGLMMAFEGLPDEPNFSFYPNGAIAFYTPEILDESYLFMANSIGLEPYARSTEPYDLHIGRTIGASGVEVAMSKVGWLRSSYSGCLNHHYTLEDRLKMLASGERVAVHQVKS